MSKWLPAVGMVVIAALLLNGCAATPSTPPTPIIQTQEVPGPTQVVTATPTPTPTPGPATLVVCLDAEPESLYLYGGSPAAGPVLEAIYDGPIDHRSFGFQPVILEKLPSLEDGDAYFELVTVQPGSRVVDINGQPTTLEAGVQVFPSHTCVDAANPACVVTADGTSAIQMEQMVVSWQLVQGLTWSDGEPLTADDSVYSYELACDPDTPPALEASEPHKELCARTASYVAAGERTVVWSGLPGYVRDPLYLSYVRLYFDNFFPPLPRHLWQRQLGYDAADLLTRPESTRTPLGWGPFVITGWTQGQEITLERNPRYFRADEGLPRVERLIFRFAADANERVSRLLAGECDIAAGEGELGLLSFLEAAQQQGLLTVVASPGDIWEHLEFGIVPVRTYNRANFLGDARVRQAIAQCVDRQAMVDEVTFGRGQVADDYIPPQHPLYAGEQLTRWAYDPAAGRALLAAVGWRDTDADGVLEADDVTGVRDGTELRLTLLTVQGDANREAVARIVRSNLLDCGIQVELTTAPAWELFNDGPSGPIYGRQFDLAVFPWWNEIEPPCYLYLSEQVPDQDNLWNGANASGFSNAEYDAACRAALAALPGTFEYENAHREAQRIFSEQLPSLPLFWHIRVAAARPGVTGFTLDPSEETGLWGIEEVGIQR